MTRPNTYAAQRAPLSRPVSPLAAMLESTLRTAISMAVGAGLTALVAWLGAKGLDIKLGPNANEVVTGVVWLVLTSAYAAVQRKVWPTRTDAHSAGRTDVPVATTEPPAPPRG